MARKVMKSIKKLWKKHMYFEGKRIWKAKMSEPLVARVANEQKEACSVQMNSEDSREFDMAEKGDKNE